MEMQTTRCSRGAHHHYQHRRHLSCLITATIIGLAALGRGASAQQPSKEEVEHYNALVALRRSGFTCPNGQYFPPNDKPFLFDCRAWRAARWFSEDMATKNYFSHYTPDGRDPCSVTKSYGLMACAQNIAAGQRTALDALGAWKASKGHCPNMMDPKLNRIGVGFATGPSSTYKYYWTQNMGTDDCPVDQSCSPPGAGTYQQPPACDSCRDFSEGCANYQNYAGSPYCNEEWPRTQCPKTCGFCKVSGVSEAAASAPQPAAQAAESKTTTPRPNTAPQAKPVSGPAPSPPCVDKHSLCSAYVGYAGTTYCSRAWHNGWAVDNCPKACRLCA
jgi:hypothetical protein